MLLFSGNGTAQEKDTLKIPQRYGLRLGIDAHRLTKSLYNDNYKGLELVGDYRITKKFYAAGELGNEEKLQQTTTLIIQQKGVISK